MPKKPNIEQRLAPPAELKLAAEKAAWKRIVNAYSGDFFNEGDIPLLVSYVRLQMAADRLHKEYTTSGEVVRDSKGDLVMSMHYRAFMSTAEKLGGLAQKLRIAPSARMRQEAPKQSASNATGGRSWSPGSDWRDHQQQE